jgi:hemerythrin-like metal-binding protein
MDETPQPPFLSGVDRIDRQHVALLGAIHELRGAMRTPGGEEALPGIMATLATYVEEHFAYEEAYMRHIGFPGLAEHFKEHAYFRAQVHQLNQRVAVGDTTVALELSSVLFKWFKNHLLQEDILYVEHARRRKD